MVNADNKSVTHGLCKECGKGGWLGDGLCRDCIQKRAVEEHYDFGGNNLPNPDFVINDFRNPMTPPVVRIKKGWGN